MTKFIEAHDTTTGKPVAINIDTIARVYEKDDGTCGLVLTTFDSSAEWYDGIDFPTVEMRSDRVAVRGTYMELMQKIMTAR